MTLWQFMAAVDGYAKANGGGEPEHSITSEDMERWANG